MSTSEGNVSIEKIESGSFFAKISANPLVIALASIIVTNGSQYIYNEIDSSRDLTNLKEASEVLERTLKIRSFLEENEIDTKEIDEEIKISSVLLAKNLGLLIKDSSEIEINDNKITTPNGHNLIGKAKPALENK
ncbi:hypothetical protein NG726_26555 [Pseudomonas sp. MOB-449]|nr:hypothetical protein [Pseudomonas sp. MOB-449]